MINASRIILSTFLMILMIVFSSKGQTSGNIMIGGGFDIIKSDINTFAGKVQTGFEANYFINRSFSISGGFEIWSAGNNSVALGLRWYPISNLFTRFRGLIGQDDFGIGLGYAYVLNANWQIEGVGDYFLNQGELGLRMGVAYVIRK
jgi:hypothetical protein